MHPVGVVSIQGDYEQHIRAFRAVGVEAVEVRTPEKLAHVQRAVIPGGESTTVGLLMQRYGMGDALRQAASEGMPIWGTCMGMILLAKEVEGREQWTLGLLDIAVRRNAFGAQVHSFEDEVPVEGLEEPVMGVFIRAPVVTRLGEGVQAIAHYCGQIVGVRKDNLIGTSFHPELTEDGRLHTWFAGL